MSILKDIWFYISAVFILTWAMINYWRNIDDIHFCTGKLTSDDIEVLKKARTTGIVIKNQNAWQPIETAPKIGKVLLYFPCYKHPQIGWYNEPSNQYHIIESFSSKNEPYVEPTHWMPLPETPKENF